MSKTDVDEVLNYLTVKFNKIFCDREFVCSVIEDFERILEDKTRCCVLVFPTLGPIYLKALRYQARIFDLTVFNVTTASGKFKSLAVCHKDHLKKTEQMKGEVMSENSSKKKRPERQLYIPPAQRASRLSTKRVKKCIDAKCPSDPSTFIFGLSDIVNLFYFFDDLPCSFQDMTTLHQHSNCEFRRFLQFKQIDNSLNYSCLIKIYDHCQYLSNVTWKLDQFSIKNKTRQFKSYPIIDLEIDEIGPKRPTAILVHSIDLTSIYLDSSQFENHTVYKIDCEAPTENFVLDLSILEMGHLCIVSIDGNDYFYESQEKHDPIVCYTNVQNQLKIEPLKETMKVTPNTNNDFVKNKINKKTDSDKKHEQEKEIMRLTKEYMNRKTKPIMKYVDDANNTLKINNNDSVNNWEDLFDDNGQIQDGLFTEILDKVGDDITIVKASEDYSAYMNKPPEDLEHVVELYNFPATLETHDLVQAFSDINSDAMYIKWVDDTHALLVLGSLSQAQKAINMKNPLIKVRPMTAASAISIDVANKSDLKPAMKRPPTNLQTARRLITSHLGAKSKITKEQMAKEKQDLKNAREMKRLIKQNERDAWEGNLRSSVN